MHAQQDDMMTRKSGRWVHEPHSSQGFPWGLVVLVGFTVWLFTQPGAIT